jgi:3-isopropylmalate/(R)-2-methylmalate dehydratase small subunit
MKPFEVFTGIVAHLPNDNIDTDAIIPSREIVSPEKTGFGEKLFSSWRYLDKNYAENTEFILNKEPYRDSSILLSGHNFGCGSSREMAVWALAQFGFKVVIAKSFGEIFRNNCNKNGLLTIQISDAAYLSLSDLCHKHPCQLKVNLADQLIEAVDETNEFKFHFDIDATLKEYFLSGQDAISKTLEHQLAIHEFCQTDRKKRPWMWES